MVAAARKGGAQETNSVRLPEGFLLAGSLWLPDYLGRDQENRVRLLG